MCFFVRGVAMYQLECLGGPHDGMTEEIEDDAPQTMEKWTQVECMLRLHAYDATYYDKESQYVWYKHRGCIGEHQVETK